ncbi:MAG: UDP-N-acetylmuramate:L-alanyl-gamma-D-glutamyl-meso-diaminopimelate ligase [Magnetococcales bacterium]|nr:UDP-N-acetylmuramate:L-alanyl-gamma-D-glutamyl-meso-diaminopimelate ligase [Magnetococcales bacterium]NGZ25607.1 UDP-N-acetylmuramate:L-alanyl-gamma-D-glutamyl-meso-diaminopimelate ligase [Magnetococcales bacterium]
MAHLHIIGICGTAMAALAALAQESQWQVSGSDSDVYPPMSTFLAERGIKVQEGYRADNLQPPPDLVLVGNAISRGNPELEALLDSSIPFMSGADWLHRHVLNGRHPVVVAGTHGKTTTSSLTAWLLEEAGWQPGFLIGGIPLNFGQGARFPQGNHVVVEGDEYDTAFFDKQAKFLHYWPRTLVLHNLEYDHADIYPDLESIRRQFRLLLRCVPSSGQVIANGDDPEIRGLLDKVYSPVVLYGFDPSYPYAARLLAENGSHWQLLRQGEPVLEVQWSLLGRHNIQNGLAAAAVALELGAEVERVQRGLNSFQGVARRLQLRFTSHGVAVYDDFAHHPTAIATTIAGLRASLSTGGRIWVVVEPRSNTMRRRIHQDRLPQALSGADGILLARPAARGLPAHDLLDVDAIAHHLQSVGRFAQVVESAQEAINRLTEACYSGDHVVIMSNGGFDGIHDRLQLAMERDHG